MRWIKGIEPRWLKNMAKVFVDANCFIGLASLHPRFDSKFIDGHLGFVSTLSCHILCCVQKRKMPNVSLNSFVDRFTVTDLSQKILKKSLVGPTNDLEDNIQLHSAL